MSRASRHCRNGWLLQLHTRGPPNPSLEAPGAELYARAATAMWNEALQNPAKLIEQQVEFWGKTLKHYVEAQHLLAQGKLEAPPDPGPKDRQVIDMLAPTNFLATNPDAWKRRWRPRAKAW
jgi:polyhydroxyalkanoate synthase